jgi:hypothetical protein
MRLARSLSLGLAAAALAAVFWFAPALAGNLTTTVNHGVAAHYTGTNTLGTSGFDLSLQAQPPISLQNGYGNNQADLIYTATATIAASSSATLDLYGGLTDPFGATLNFAKIKLIKITAKATNTNSVVVGNAGSNPFLGPLGGTTPTLTIPPGGMIVLAAPIAGWAVTNSSTDNLKIANSSSGTGVDYTIVIVGTSQ